MATRDQVKQWFETGDYPTQEQFYQLFDSILFTGEVAPADIAGLIELLQAKADLAQFNAFYKGELINTGGNVQYLQSANTLLEKIVLIPGADCAIRIGVTDGGDEIMPDVDVQVVEYGTYPIILNAFTAVDRTLYINGIPANSKLIVLKRPLKTI